MNGTETVVVKIGGSTLGAHDTTLEDVAALWHAGRPVIVVHGGGAEITRWLEIHQLPSHFVDGLRVTDGPARDVVVAVLAGLINKTLVAQLAALDVRAAGLCGADGGLLRATVGNPALGFVGSVGRVDLEPLHALLGAGLLPVIAPIALSEGLEGGPQLLNVNADTVAGEVAAATGRCRLVFLTDVAGVLDGDGQIVATLDRATRERLRGAGVLKGGMLPKIDACVRAASAGATAVIVDGRQPHALSAALDTRPHGTLVAC